MKHLFCATILSIAIFCSSAVADSVQTRILKAKSTPSGATIIPHIGFALQLGQKLHVVTFVDSPADDPTTERSSVDVTINGDTAKVLFADEPSTVANSRNEVVIAGPASIFVRLGVGRTALITYVIK